MFKYIKHKLNNIVNVFYNMKYVQIQSFKLMLSLYFLWVTALFNCSHIYIYTFINTCYKSTISVS
jgi:hypothetical protein